MVVSIIAAIVPHLLCKGNMVVPHLDFRKSPQSTRSSSFIELTQNQIQKLFRSVFTAKHLYHLNPPLYSLTSHSTIPG